MKTTQARSRFERGLIGPRKTERHTRRQSGGIDVSSTSDVPVLSGSWFRFIAHVRSLFHETDRFSRETMTPSAPRHGIGSRTGFPDTTKVPYRHRGIVAVRRWCDHATFSSGVYRVIMKLRAPIVTFILLSFLGAESATAAKRQEEAPKASHDGLELLPDTEVAMAYVKPGADFSGYKRLMILDAYVAFRKGWEDDQRRSSVNKISSRDIERIKGDADTSDLSSSHGMIRVVTDLGRKVEGDGEPALTLLEEVSIAPIGLRGRGVAGVLAHRPESAAIARGVVSAGEGRLAGPSELGFGVPVPQVVTFVLFLEFLP